MKEIASDANGPMGRSPLNPYDEADVRQLHTQGPFPSVLSLPEMTITPTVAN